MTNVVWKYELPIGPMFELEMPARARILTLQEQRLKPTIWCAVDPDAPKVTRKFGIIATGNPVDFELPKYIGTFQMFGGDTVLHVFEFLDEALS